MQLITAVIRPHSLEDVKDALRSIGVQGMTITEVKGFGRQGGHTETYRGAEYKVEFIPKTKIEILTEATQTQRITEAIVEAAQTGKIGDGKIWITNVDSAIRIRTGALDVF